MTFYDLGNTNPQSRMGQCWKINGKFIILRTKFDIIHTEDQTGGAPYPSASDMLQGTISMHSAFMRDKEPGESEF